MVVCQCGACGGCLPKNSIERNRHGGKITKYVCQSSKGCVLFWPLRQILNQEFN